VYLPFFRALPGDEGGLSEAILVFDPVGMQLDGSWVSGDAQRAWTEEHVEGADQAVAER
jgi:hypothetical protein